MAAAATDVSPEVFGLEGGMACSEADSLQTPLVEMALIPFYSEPEEQKVPTPSVLPLWGTSLRLCCPKSAGPCRRLFMAIGVTVLISTLVEIYLSEMGFSILFGGASTQGGIHSLFSERSVHSLRRAATVVSLAACSLSTALACFREQRRSGLQQLAVLCVIGFWVSAALRALDQTYGFYDWLSPDARRILDLSKLANWCSGVCAVVSHVLAIQRLLSLHSCLVHQLSRCRLLSAFGAFTTTYTAAVLMASYEGSLSRQPAFVMFSLALLCMCIFIATVLHGFSKVIVALDNSIQAAGSSQKDTTITALRFVQREYAVILVLFASISLNCASTWLYYSPFAPALFGQARYVCYSLDCSVHSSCIVYLSSRRR
eukprot:TRINITY_DN19100_c0_g2_i1.p1 TRINITY_DN19100_c0_g2~~TRINITY_DN19100_c0_g2_i1.p1  ORF type:complete len:372 (-),score=44.80 TRINITY_DN19100_c0_g2_i1:67-1182(-)